MILVDFRKGPNKGSTDFRPMLNKLGLKAQTANLEFGDFAFEGNGPKGPMLIGIERKSLHDMLSCIDDSRFSAHQRVGMLKMYKVSILILEGVWKPHDETGMLMEGFERRIETKLGMRWEMAWAPCKPGGRSVEYAKLRRYLFSMMLGGVYVDYTRNQQQTAYDVHEWYHYFQKPWRKHKSLLEMQKLALPSLTGPPSVVRQWANALDGIGAEKSDAAARIFKTPFDLAYSDEDDWMQIPGVAMPTAERIIKTIRTGK